MEKQVNSQQDWSYWPNTKAEEGKGKVKVCNGYSMPNAVEVRALQCDRCMAEKLEMW